MTELTRLLLAGGIWAVIFAVAVLLARRDVRETDRRLDEEERRERETGMW